MHTIIKGVGLNGSTMFTQFDFLALNGTILASGPLTRSSVEPSVYVTGANLVPLELFILQVGEVFL